MPAPAYYCTAIVTLTLATGRREKARRFATLSQAKDYLADRVAREQVATATVWITDTCHRRHAVVCYRGPWNRPAAATVVCTA